MATIDEVVLLAQNLLLVRFTLSMKLDSVLASTSNYTVIPNGSGQTVQVNEIIMPSGSASRDILVSISPITVGASYTISLTNLRTSSGDIINPADSTQEFIGRVTKLDNMRDISSIYDNSAKSVFGKILAAISIEDDLIGGSRDDRIRTGITLASIPLTVSDYTSLGFPAPDYIWDLGSTDLPFVETVVGGGTNDLVDQGANSVDWVHAVTPPGLSVPQKIALRDPDDDGGGTSRALHSSSSFLDVTTSERVAIGHMWRIDATPGSTVRFWQKRASPGYYGGLNNSLYPFLFCRDNVSSDVTTTVTTAHPVGVWHYGIWVIDRDPGVELIKMLTELGSDSQDISGQGTLTVSSTFGFHAVEPGQHYTGALCAWTGSKVASLTQPLCQRFLNKVGA